MRQVGERGARFLLEVRDLWPDSAIAMGLVREMTWRDNRPLSAGNSTRPSKSSCPSVRSLIQAPYHMAPSASVDSRRR